MPRTSGGFRAATVPSGTRAATQFEPPPPSEPPFRGMYMSGSSGACASESSIKIRHYLGRWTDRRFVRDEVNGELAGPARAQRRGFALGGAQAMGIVAMNALIRLERVEGSRGKCGWVEGVCVGRFFICCAFVEWVLVLSGLAGLEIGGEVLN